MSDLGSGCLLDSTRYGLAHEPMPQQAIAAGVDLSASPATNCSADLRPAF